MSELIERQIQVIIAMLARETIGAEQIGKIVSGGKKKGDPRNFVRAYNRLDGTTTIKELIKIVGGTAQNMGQVLQAWEEKGIVFKVGTSRNTRYFGLMKLTESSKGQSKSKKPKRPKKVYKRINRQASQSQSNHGDRTEFQAPNTNDAGQQV